VILDADLGTRTSAALRTHDAIPTSRDFIHAGSSYLLRRHAAYLLPQFSQIETPCLDQASGDDAEQHL